MARTQTPTKQRTAAQIIAFDGSTDSFDAVNWATNTLTVAAGTIYVMTPEKQYIPKNKSVVFDATAESIVVFDTSSETFKAVTVTEFNTYNTNYHICGHVNPTNKIYDLDIRLKPRKNAEFVNLDRNTMPYVNIKNRSVDFFGEAWYAIWNDSYVKISNNTQVVFPQSVSTAYMHVNKQTGELILFDAAKHKLHSTSQNYVYMGFFHLYNLEATFGVRRSHKNISFFGDSIWTFTGHTVAGNTCFYPAASQGQVLLPSLMNFHKISQALGSVCANNSFSGSRITKTNFPSPPQPGINSLDRIAKIVKGDGTKPDMIIISQGLNDYLNHVTLHEADLPTGADKDTAFDHAYRNILTQFQALCPQATIVMTSIGRFNYWSGTNAGAIIPNVNGNTPEQFNEVIKSLAKEFDCIYIDFWENTGITKGNFSTYYVDLFHPNIKGQQYYANKIINALKEDF